MYTCPRCEQPTAIPLSQINGMDDYHTMFPTTVFYEACARASQRIECTLSAPRLQDTHACPECKLTFPESVLSASERLDALRQSGQYLTCNRCGIMSDKNPCPICGEGIKRRCDRCKIVRDVRDTVTVNGSTLCLKCDRELDIPMDQEI